MTDEERKAKNREYQRRYRERHGEKAKQRVREWHAAHPERMRELRQRWHDKQTADQKRARYESNRAESIARAAAWNKENVKRRAEILRKHSQRDHVRARARLRNHPRSVREWVMVLLGDPCSYCGAPTEHIDHIVPVVRGGPTTPDNLTAACASCNGSKYARSLLDFLLYKE